jgi:PAS domain S-box-containing protein
MNINEPIENKAELVSEIVKNIDTGILILNGPEIIYANDWVFKKSGYLENEIYGKENFGKFIADGFKEKVIEYNKKRTSGDLTLPEQYEIKVLIKNGNYLWLDCNVSTVTVNKNIIILFFMKDITEFKKTEENYSTIFELSPDAISISKLSDGKIIEINKAFSEITGYEKEEILHKSIYEMIVNYNKDDLIKEIIEKGMVHGKRMILKNKSGGNVFVSMSSRHLGEHTNKFVISITRDISTIVKQEEKITETMIKNKTLYSSLMNLLDSTSYFIWIKDLNNNILFANKALRKIFDVEEDFVNVNGTNLSSLFDLGQNSRDNNKLVIESKKENTFTEKFTVNGENHIFNTFKTPVFDKDKNVIGISCMAVEIVDTKYIQERLDSFTEYVNEKQRIISNIIEGIKIKKEEN